MGRKIRWSSGAEISFKSLEYAFDYDADPALILKHAGDQRAIAEINEKASEVLAGGGRETDQLLYLITPEGEDRVCKVGIAQRPLERLASLQTSCWRELKIAALFCPVRGKAASVEVSVLAKAKRRNNHIRGEWLSLPAAEAVSLVMATLKRNELKFSGPDMWAENLAARVNGLRTKQLHMRREQEEFAAKFNTAI